ncbi:beta-lactamase, partial [Novosphingobium barchaimii]
SYSSVLQGSELNNPDRAWNPRELLAYGIASPRLNPPGAAFADSDTNYLIAGLAAERATGETLSDLIRERVAEPLGLSNTSLPGSAAAAPSSTALEGFRSQQLPEGGWTCDQPQDVTVTSSSYGGAAAGAVTDITDLGRYTQALAAGSLLPEGSDRFSSPLPVGADDPTWFTAAGGAYQAGSLIGQFGATAGYMVGS